MVGLPLPSSPTCGKHCESLVTCPDCRREQEAAGRPRLLLSAHGIMAAEKAAAAKEAGNAAFKKEAWEEARPHKFMFGAEGAALIALFRLSPEAGKEVLQRRRHHRREHRRG